MEYYKEFLIVDVIIPLSRGEGLGVVGACMKVSVGDSLLEGVYQDVVCLDTTVCLGQSESHGILVKITSELVHG